MKLTLSLNIFCMCSNPLKILTALLLFVINFSQSDRSLPKITTWANYTGDLTASDVSSTTAAELFVSFWALSWFLSVLLLGEFLEVLLMDSFLVVSLNWGELETTSLWIISSIWLWFWDPHAPWAPLFCPLSERVFCWQQVHTLPSTDSLIIFWATLLNLWKSSLVSFVCPLIIHSIPL